MFATKLSSFHQLLCLLVLLLLLVGCGDSAPVAEAPAPETTVAPTETPTDQPTDTPPPVNTPTDTPTLEPTVTPEPTNTPEPTTTPETSALDYLQDGEAAFTQGNYEEALALYNQALELDSELATVYNNRGLVYVDLTEHEQALADFNQALALDPNHTKAYSNRGMLHLKLGDYEQAIADTSQAIELDDTVAEAYSNRGEAYRNLGDFEQALADYNIAIDLKPTLFNALNNRGTLYQQTGEYGLAIADFTQALELNPDLLMSYFNRGVTHYSMGDYEAAIADFETSIELDSTFILGYSSLGGTYYDLEEYETAIGYYTQVLELDPNNDDAYLNLGAMYQILGDDEQAVASFEKLLAISSDPDYLAYGEEQLALLTATETDESAIVQETVVEVEPTTAHNFPLVPYEPTNQAYTIAHPEGWEVNEATHNLTTFVKPGTGLMMVLFDDAEKMYEGKAVAEVMQTEATRFLDILFQVDAPTFIDEQVNSNDSASVTATFDIGANSGTFTANFVFDRQGDVGFMTLFAVNNYDEFASMWQVILTDYYQLNPDMAKQALAPVKLSIYQVNEYDPVRDPNADLEAAVAEAKTSNKRVLLVIGGDWCITCHQLDRFLQKNPEVGAAMERNFVMVKVNYSEDNRNETFLAQYPDFEWVPNYIIIDSEGDLVHSYDTRNLETDGVHTGDKIMAFVAEWGVGL